MRPTHHPQEVLYIGPPPVNRLGKTGFWTSLLGLAVCGLLSPLGLAMSFFALSKKPRGAAIAGLILGLLGSVWLGMWGALAVGGAVTAAKRQEAAAAYQVRTTLVQAEGVIEHYRQDTGRLPEGIAGNKLVLTFTDAWQNPLRYDLFDNGSYLIRSAGPDQKFDTSDDLTRRHAAADEPAFESDD